MPRDDGGLLPNTIVIAPRGCDSYAMRFKHGTRTAGRRARRTGFAALAMVLAMAPGPLGAFQSLDFIVSGEDKALTSALQAASSLRAARSEKVTNPQDILSAARAEYGRLLGALYAQGHYSAVISVRVDGREAADIAPLELPRSIGQVVVRVDPGPVFTFRALR